MNKSLLVLMVVLSGSVYAGPSKWVDERGEVHYSDHPPNNRTHVEQLHFPDQPSAPPADNPYERKSTAEMEADFQRAKAARDKDAQKEAQVRAAAAAKQANCIAARNNLKVMEQSRRLYELDGNGERVYLDDNQRQRQLDAAQQAVSQYCN